LLQNYTQTRDRNITSRQPQTKIKSRERKQVTKTTNYTFKNIVAQHQVEQWEDKKGMEPILPPKK
jgi:hypothetical protein